MQQILTFRLYAPLGAMGGVAVGEQRDGWDRPGRSAVLGLTAACLGLDRTDEAAQQALEQGYGVGLLIEHAGPVLIDYHTAQVPPARRGIRYATRAEELADRQALGTILSRRAYRADVLVLGAVWERAAPRWPLTALAEAMQCPRFTPYLGRKSCPLGLPLAPRIEPAADPVAALRARRAEPAEAILHAQILPWRRNEPLLALDAADVPVGYPGLLRTERRRDALASRARWQFDLRDEAVLRLLEPPPCS